MFWIGMWTTLFLLLITAFDLSSLVLYITRFTEEGFACLVAIIFIYEAIKELIDITHDYHITPHSFWWADYNCSCVPKPFVKPAANMSGIGHAANMSGFGHAANMFSFGHAANGSAFGNDSFFMNNFTTPLVPYQVFANETSSNLSQAAYCHSFDRDYHHCKVSDFCKMNGDQYCGVYPDVFFLSVILCLGTFFVATYLKGFKATSFFPTKVRGMISDFAVFLAIIMWVVIDALLQFNTPKLVVPDQFRPTSPKRGFIINPFLNPVWTYFIGSLFAILGTILIFLDQQITAVIVNRAENKLKKGVGYHLDLLIITLLVALNSVLGLPWYVANTVLAINHVDSLKLDSPTTAPGQKPTFIGVREQRVTGTMIFVLIGLSVFMTNLLKFVPMAVLYGVFLYMGFSALGGLQFFERILILFMPVKYQPDAVYLRHVALKRVHMFTAIQITCFIALWVVKMIKTISIGFPLMVLALVVVRLVLNQVFTQDELQWLDDVMPDFKKREQEEEQKEVEKRHSLALPPTGSIQIPLKGGKVMNIPVKHIKYTPDSNVMCVNDEEANKAVWKQLVANETTPDVRFRGDSTISDEERRPLQSEVIDEEQERPPNVQFIA